MKVKINPCKLQGTIKAPPSKSMAHRLLICAGLSQGESEIKNIAFSEDILATIDCLKSMGAVITMKKDSVKVRGVSPFNSVADVFACRESGSTLRFFIPLSMLSEKENLFTGYGRLMQRPMTVYEGIAEEKGITFLKDDRGITVGGALSSGRYTVNADISSQFISGLMFALPFCEGESEIVLEGKISSKSYIDMTAQALSFFGVTIIWKNENTLYIKGNQRYTSCDIAAEGDYSNGAFLDAFNYMGSDVTVTGLSENTLQGDSIYKEYFSLLKDGTPTQDITNCPDLAPILMTLASELNGAVLKGTHRLKIKESDRGQVMKRELSKFGASIDVLDDEIVIHKSILHTPQEALYSHNDHRVVMSLAVLCSKYGGEIENAEAVTKSYPDFFEKIKTIGLEVESNDN